MIINCSQGKIIVNLHEIQCRFNVNNMVLMASVDDITCYHQGLVIAADAGTVKWSIKLDSAEQLELILNETGIQAL